MRVHVIRHVPFEGPGLIAHWAAERGHTLTEQLALTEEFPDTGEVDLLVVLGGPMGAGETDRYPWLAAEKRYLQHAIATTRVFGVCLGAQLITDVAGGSVYRAENREIGWFAVHTTGAAWRDPVFGDFPGRIVVGHWHGDTFSLPGLTMPSVSSDACPNQAFTLCGGRVAGVQFHLEWTAEDLQALIERCGDDLAEPGPYVSTAEQLVAGVQEWGATCRKALFGVLDALCRVDAGKGQE